MTDKKSTDVCQGCGLRPIACLCKYIKEDKKRNPEDSYKPKEKTNVKITKTDKDKVFAKTI